MSGKRLWIAVLIAVIMLAASAFAQKKNEIAGGVGRTFVADQGIAQGAFPLLNNTVHFGNGLSFEINYARRLLNGDLLALDAEVPFVGNPDEDLASGNGAVPSQYSSYFITPAARVKFFPQGGLAPWVSFGGGYGHFNVSKAQVGGGINPGPSSKSSGLLQAGLGLDVKPFKKLTLRLAARDFWSASLPLQVPTGKTHQHNIVVTGGFVIHF